MKQIFSIFIILTFLFGAYGWCANVWKLCHDDFQAPFRAESIRFIGAIVPPIGAVAGYVTFDKEKK